MSRQSLSIVFAERPETDIVPGKTFSPKFGPAPTANDVKEGQLLVESLYVSLDPAMRGWLNDSRSYMPPVRIGEVMRGTVLAQVLHSRSAKAAAGELVLGMVGWRELAVVEERDVQPVQLPPGARPTDALGALGLPGLTAWVGLERIAPVRPGATVVVSAAAGATGSVVGQIAKIKGARVVGIVGTEDKVRWLREELGFDVALNYRNTDFQEEFSRATPDYVDVYWDNVGGEILDTALGRANKFARFVICGSISQYNAAEVQGPKNFMNLFAQRIRMEGFIVLDHEADFPAARKDLAQWLAQGKLKRKETIVKGGLAVAEKTLIGLFKGENMGKLMVEVKSPEDAFKL